MIYIYKCLVYTPILHTQGHRQTFQVPAECSTPMGHLHHPLQGSRRTVQKRTWEECKNLRIVLSHRPLSSRSNMAFARLNCQHCLYSLHKMGPVGSARWLSVLRYLLASLATCVLILGTHMVEMIDR